MHESLRRLALAATLLAMLAASGRPQGSASQDEEGAPAAAILDLELRRLGERFHGVEFQVGAGELKSVFEIESKDPGPADAVQVARYVRLLAEELSKYPPDFVKRSKLKKVVLVKDLSLSGQLRAAVPDYAAEVLYYDFALSLGGGETYARHVVHHEYYHMLEEEWNGSPYFKDPSWAKLNPVSFDGYGPGGVRARESGQQVLRHPEPGFVNLYSRSGLEEDKAEVWAILFVTPEWKIVEPWLAEDEFLRQKVDHLRRFARGKSREMDAAYWERIHAPEKRDGSAVRQVRLTPPSPGVRRRGAGSVPREGGRARECMGTPAPIQRKYRRGRKRTRFLAKIPVPNSLLLVEAEATKWSETEPRSDPCLFGVGR